MRALTLTQPWASLVAAGEKRIETRSWSSPWRGAVAIHAAKGFPRAARELCLREPFASALRRAGYGGLALASPEQALPLGAVVAVCRLVNVVQTGEGGLLSGYNLSEREEAFGDFSGGRYGWILEDVVPLREPVPARGALGLWKVPDDLERLLRGIRPAVAAGA